MTCRPNLQGNRILASLVSKASRLRVRGRPGLAKRGKMPAIREGKMPSTLNAIALAGLARPHCAAAVDRQPGGRAADGRVADRPARPDGRCSILTGQIEATPSQLEGIEVLNGRRLDKRGALGRMWSWTVFAAGHCGRWPSSPHARAGGEQSPTTCLRCPCSRDCWRPIYAVIYDVYPE